MTRPDDLARIEKALAAAAQLAARFTPGREAVEWKAAGDPVTAADRAIDRVLGEILPREGEGWLSEETRDDRRRLGCRRVWIVDPVDGTREFTAAIPEWCISIGLVEDGVAVAGGICNPVTGETVLGSRATGVTLNGTPVRVSARDLHGGTVLASRSEVQRGEWARFAGEAFQIEPVGSVAYKLALVAAGRAEATWTLVPKHEWDVAAGVALVEAAGGEVFTLAGEPPRFNRPTPRLPGLLAGPGQAGAPAWRTYLAGLCRR